MGRLRKLTTICSRMQSRIDCRNNLCKSLRKSMFPIRNMSFKIKWMSLPSCVVSPDSGMMWWPTALKILSTPLLKFKSTILTSKSKSSMALTKVVTDSLDGQVRNFVHILKKSYLNSMFLIVWNQFRFYRTSTKLLRELSYFISLTTTRSLNLLVLNQIKYWWSVGLPLKIWMHVQNTNCIEKWKQCTCPTSTLSTLSLTYTSHTQIASIFFSRFLWFRCLA